MTIDDDFKRFVDGLRSRIDGVNMEPLYDEVGEILLESVARNFRVGGRYAVSSDGEFVGSSMRWPESRLAKEQSRQTLLDTGQLAASITKRVGPDGVTIGTNKVYAAIHHYGGAAGRGGKSILPPRPYLVIQGEDYDELIAIFENMLL